MNKKILLLIIVIILAIGGYFLLIGGKSAVRVDTNRSNGGISQPTAEKTVVNMTENGFSPSVINIKQGETVVFKNIGVQDHWPASAIHPTHQVYPEFDPKQPIASQKSWSFTFTKKGSWRFHDHLSPTFTGTVNVQ